jgi:hypothetical protein
LPFPAILGLHVTRLAALAALLATGCFGNESTEFPAGLEPLEENTAPEPDGGIAFASGDNGSYAWVHGRAIVAAEPAAVWAVIQTPEMMAAVCATDSHSIELDVEPDYELSFQVSYHVDEIVNVSWDELWRYGTIEGTTAMPTLGMVRYQKVYGSSLIDLLEGSIQLHATDDPAVTAIEFVEHLAGAGGTIEDMTASMQHRHDTVLAVVGGGEQPPCP